MKESLVDLLRDPRSGRQLTLVAFESGTDSLGDPAVTEGLLYEPATGAAFPILNAVPIMIPSAFPQAFLHKHRSGLDALRSEVPLRLGGGAGDEFSFSTQWRVHFDLRVARTWGWTVPERVEQLLLEMQVGRDWFRDKVVLDAGCGVADLSEGVAALGSQVVGLDYSSAVYETERRRANRSLQFVRGDVGAAGLKSEAFDAAWSIGVLMCTPDTYRSFAEICRLVKPGGRFYVWVYRRPETFLRRYVKHPLFDLARLIISRLPGTPQAVAVKAWANLVYCAHLVAHGSARVPYNEYLVSAYDDMTPRWRRYHTAYELAGWFHRNGFAAPVLSHWDNPYGFGLVAVKQPQARTPGMHFSRSRRLSDEDQMIVG